LPLVGLVTAALCLPFIRSVFSLGDEGVLLNGAERMLGGQRLYIDFFEFPPPGGFVLTEAWFRIAGVSFLSARLLVILTIVAIACFTFLACRLASGSALLSAVLTAEWVAMSQGNWTQTNPHWFTTLFSMVAAWAVLASVTAPRHRLRWPLIAGVAAGAAGMMIPTRGALAALAGATAFLDLRRQRVALIAYVVGGAVVPVGLLAYVVGQHALSAAFDDVIRFPAERYWRDQSVPFGWDAVGQNRPLKYLFPLAGVLAMVAVARDPRGCLRDRVFRRCAAFGFMGFIGCFPRPDMAHIGFTAPMVFPLLARCVARLTQRWRLAYRCIVVAVVIGMCVPSAREWSWSMERALASELVSTPRGRVAFIRMPEVPALLARIAATPSADSYFFYPYMPMLSFLTAREQVSKYDIFMFGYTLASQYRDACLSVMRRATWVVIDRDLTNPDVLKRTWPAMQNVRPPETIAFEQALDNGFALVAQEATSELLHRRDGASDRLCLGIAD
jgi:Dolichyl-phosphate-mannose-protein mannosyltransferase